MINKLEAILEMGGTKKDIFCLVVSGIALVMSLLKLNVFSLNMAWIAIVLCGIPIILEAIIGLVTEFDIKADVLVSLALIASVCIGEIFAAGEVAFIMQLGALLEDLTVSKARAGIEKLVKLTPLTARIINQDNEKVIPSQEVKVNDIIRVLPGESIPVDGIIIKGETSINQSVMTGESLPVDKTVGDNVSSGTVNQYGAFDMKATKVGEDSSIQRMIKLVQSADAGKAKIVGIADRWATWIVVIALAAAILTWIVTHEIIRSVTILVVFCPCALVLATPTAIMAAIGNATKHGFLVSVGDALERLANVSIITFDKTGTLTYGKPEVTKVKSITSKYLDEEIYKYLASLEIMSEHPLGKAIVECYKRREKELYTVKSFNIIPGKGLKAVINNKKVLAGNKALLKSMDINFDLINSEKSIEDGSIIIYVAIDNNLVGYALLSDMVRNESKSMIREIKDLDITPVLLTGDNKKTALAIAKDLDINEVHPQCLPEDKLSYIAKYQNEQKKVCMIGDGINDAPALKKSNVGIAMGGIGSDIAVDAADIVLVDDKVQELPHLIALSKRMMITIKCNLAFSLTLNFIAIILAMTGILNPVVGALVHNMGSVFVIINAAFLLKWSKKNNK